MSGPSGTEGEESEERLSIDRRRLLQAAGAGIGSATLAGFGGDVVSAKTGCANGPFAASYEAGVVDVGRIRAEQARDGGHDAMGAAEPGSRDAARTGGGTPPGNAQGQWWGGDGSLEIGAEYDGVNSLETRGGVPSDSQVAAGYGQLIHALNRQVAIYNKRSGHRSTMFPLERLWEPVIPEPEGGFVYGEPFVFDPRARYDRKDDRFVLCATQYEPGITESGEIIDREDLEEAAREGEDEAVANVSRPPRGWFVVAVSATPNPNGKWYVYRVPPVDADGVDNEGLVDYPTLGFDRDAVYMAQNFFPAEGPVDVTMVALDKEAMYDGGTVTAHHFDGMSDPGADGLTFTVHPAQQPYSGGEHGTFYLANSNFPTGTGSETLTVWELTDPVSDPSLECFTVDVDPYFYPDPARQPESDSRIDTLGTRLMNVDFDEGSLWMAHSTAVDWNGDGTSVAAIRWYELDASSHEVVQSGTYGEPGTSYFMPTVGAEDGDAVVVHNVSGPETFVRMDVAGRTEDYTPGELEDSVAVQDGESKYDALPGDVERWGDYNGFSVDPQSGRFWTVSQYSPDIDIPLEEDERDPYFTRIAEVYFDDHGRGHGKGGDDHGRGDRDGRDDHGDGRGH